MSIVSIDNLETYNREKPKEVQDTSLLVACRRLRSTRISLPSLASTTREVSDETAPDRPASLPALHIQLFQEILKNIEMPA